MVTTSPAPTNFGGVTKYVRTIGATGNAIDVDSHGSEHVIVYDSNGDPLDYSGSTPVAGDVAHDAVDSGSPVKIGGKARQTNPTAVADGDRVDAAFDDVGRQVVMPHGVRDLLGDQFSTITSSTNPATIVTALASTFLDLIGLVITNKSATGTLVEIYDDDGTTVRTSFYADPTHSTGFMLPTILKQPTVNKAWKAKTVTSVDSVYITALFVKNV